MLKKDKGFTLIEIMIVILIIGLLASIAIPFYYNYMQRAATQACLYEAKAYSNMVFINLFDQSNNESPPAPILNNCSSITDASTWTISTVGTVVAVTKKYNIVIECDVAHNASCRLR